MKRAHKGAMKRAHKEEIKMKRSKLVYTGDTQGKENLLQFQIILLLQHIK